MAKEKGDRMGDIEGVGGRWDVVRNARRIAKCTGRNLQEATPRAAAFLVSGVDDIGMIVFFVTIY